MKRIVSLLSMTVLSAAMLNAGAPPGKPAPDFKAEDIHRESHRLSDYKGKVVVLEAYNYDCPYCRNHYDTGAMQDLQKWARENGVVWFVVNSVNPQSSSYRSPDQAKEEFKQRGMHATAWLHDSTGELGKTYGMKTTPHMIVINKKGTVVYNGAIDDQPDVSHDPSEAQNYVKKALKAVLAGEPVETERTKPYGCAVKY